MGSHYSDGELKLKYHKVPAIDAADDNIAVTIARKPNDNIDSVVTEFNNVDSKSKIDISPNDSNEDCEMAVEEKRPSWDNKFQYLMAALGFAVGLGNIWRFPYLCKKNGGGAFLIPYVIMLIIEGYPLYYLELAIGQKIRKGTIGVWSHVNPYLGGIGFASNVISIIIGLYYNVILGWALFYLFCSFQSPLPWSECPTLLMENSTVQIPVHECNVSSPTNYFWYRLTLDISYTIEDGGELNWRMVIVLMLAWLCVFLGMNKGIKSSGKVMYFATSFPYAVLLAFFIRGMTLDGAVEGVQYMFSPDLSRLKDASVWREAATQIFFSLGLGYGTIIAYSSYNSPKNNCRKDAVFIATANCLTSLFACITVFSILGFKAKVKYLECVDRNVPFLEENFPSLVDDAGLELGPLRQLILTENPGLADAANINSTLQWLNNNLGNCSIARELDQDVQGTGLAFIAFAEAVLNFPGSNFWAVLFFFMLVNIGMSSEFGILQTVVTTVLDSPGVKLPKWLVTAVMSAGMLLIGLTFTQRSGSYFLDIFDTYSATLGLATICLLEVVCISYVYGIDRFKDDCKEMTGVRPGLYWTVSWMATCPLALAVILVASLYELFTKPLQYRGWNPRTGAADALTFPGWAQALIVFLLLAAVTCIPAVALLYHRGIFKPEKFAALQRRDETTAAAVTDSTFPLTENAVENN